MALEHRGADQALANCAPPSGQRARQAGVDLLPRQGHAPVTPARATRPCRSPATWTAVRYAAVHRRIAADVSDISRRPSQRLDPAEAAAGHDNYAARIPRFISRNPIASVLTSKSRASSAISCSRERACSDPTALATNSRACSTTNACGIKRAAPAVLHHKLTRQDDLIRRPVGVAPHWLWDIHRMVPLARSDVVAAALG
jgi:hypothetical protein